MGWTDDKIKALKRLWDEGKSTGEIGKAIDMSKNAVVGKAHRLNLKPRPSPIKKGGHSDSGSLPQSKATAKMIKEQPVVSEARPDSKAKSNKKGVALVDLTMHTCRWPIGDPKDANFHFCGKEVELGKPYCAEHLAQAFVGIKR